MSGEILIWDSAEPPPIHGGTIVLWRLFTSKSSTTEVSIPALIEENSKSLKARYLSWIYDLGQAVTQDSKVAGKLQIRENLSYWWMTTVAEKFNYSTSPQITDAIRLMAFDFWASGQTIKEVEFLSSNEELINILENWCVKKSIVFRSKKIAQQVSKVSIRRQLFNLLPLLIQALLVFSLYVIDRWKFRKVGILEWRESEAKLSFISYLFSLPSSTIEENRFKSPYWADLPDELSRLEKKSNWLHIYIKDSNLPRSVDAVNYLRALNSTSNYQAHTTLDAFLSIRIVFKTLREWLKLRVALNELDDVLESISSGNLDLWPLYTQEWRTSASGPSLIQNLLVLNLFDSAMAVLPEQLVGIYLFEQQPWEMALISAWKRSGHKKLVGAQHAAMLYWDLRNFHDARSYEAIGDLSLPLPDVFAINGPLAMKMCEAWDYPRSKLVEVEALRYLHLISTQTPSSHSPMTKHPFRLLVLGDYLQVNTDLQMELLEQAIPFLPTGIEIIVKPHPNCPISSNRFKIGGPTINTAPIAELVRECDVAFSSAATSAALDAYCIGLPVITIENLNELNLSPLRGVNGVSFVSSHNELASKVTELMSSQPHNSIPIEIFTLDSNLARWKRLLL
jgi:surface carbohydrate biosynthesis protein (TIGR04326 family)